MVPIHHHDNQDYIQPTELILAKGRLPTTQLRQLFDNYEQLVASGVLTNRTYPFSTLISELIVWALDETKLSDKLRSILAPNTIPNAHVMRDSLAKVRTLSDQDQKRLADAMLHTHDLMVKLLHTLDLKIEVAQTNDPTERKAAQAEFTFHAACFNQHIADSLYHMNVESAKGNKEAEAERRALMTLLEILIAFSQAQSKGTEIRRMPDAKYLIGLVDGAKAQAAVIQVLKNPKLETRAGGKYLCFIPDWEENDGQEVREWDVDGNTDVVVVSPRGSIYFLNIEGSRFDERNGPNVERTEDEVKPFAYYPPNHDKISHQIMQQLLQKEKEGKVSRKVKEVLLDDYRAGHLPHVQTLTLIVPTNEKMMDEFGRIKSDSVIKSIVNSLG
jgi:hypothetical protein